MDGNSQIFRYDMPLFYRNGFQLKDWELYCRMPIICKICGKAFKSITASHLRKHFTNMVTYKIIYPKAPLRDEETCQKISDSLKK